MMYIMGSSKLGRQIAKAMLLVAFNYSRGLVSKRLADFSP
jgi:hypothetical protein